MRFASIFALALALRVLAETASTDANGDSELSTRSVPLESDPPASNTPTRATTSSEPGNTDTATNTFSTVVPTASTASGGGATCVQFCLAKAASQVGCKNSADVPCICQRTYIRTAQDCFTSSSCEDADSQSAVGDYGTVCRGGNPSSETNRSSRSTSSTPRTKSYSGSLASLTTQTLVVTSGAVVTLSGGGATTITSGFATTRTGQAGDFATGGPFSPEPGASEAASNNAIITRPIGREYGGILVAFGAVAGALVITL